MLLFVSLLEAGCLRVDGDACPPRTCGPPRDLIPTSEPVGFPSGLDAQEAHEAALFSNLLDCRPMVVAALLPERTLVAEVLPSRFGGSHRRLAPGPRRVDPVTLMVTDDDDDGLDIPRLLSRPLVAGQARRVAALLRRLPDGPVPPASVDGSQAHPLGAIVTAWAQALGARGVSRLEVLPRLRGVDGFSAVAQACQEAGIAVETLSPRHERPLLLLDDSELIHWPSWRVVADAGQFAMLAAGLAPDVAAAIIEAAGADGHEVWDKGFDDVTRALFVQRIERVIRGADHTGQAGVVRLTMATMVPPLALSTSKVASLSNLPDVSERVRSLAQQHRARQQLQRASLLKLVFELRLPTAKPAWWAERLADLDRSAPIDLVSSSSSVCADVVAALAGHGVIVEEPTAGWLLAEVGDAGDGVVAGAERGPRTSSSATPARAIGGVRSGALDLVPDADGPQASFPATTHVPVQPRAQGQILVPATARGLRVTVDGQALADTELVLGAEHRSGRDGARVLTLPTTFASGSVVVVAWDDPEDVVVAPSPPLPSPAAPSPDGPSPAMPSPDVPTVAPTTAAPTTAARTPDAPTAEVATAEVATAEVATATVAAAEPPPLDESTPTNTGRDP